MRTPRQRCIFGFLDEGCKTNVADTAILQNLHSMFGKDKESDKLSLRYAIPKKSPDRDFVVRHYAGEVPYIITGFGEKNKDELSDDLTELLTKHTQSGRPTIERAIVPASVS